MAGFFEEAFLTEDAALATARSAAVLTAEQIRNIAWRPFVNLWGNEASNVIQYLREEYKLNNRTTPVDNTLENAKAEANAILTWQWRQWGATGPLDVNNQEFKRYLLRKYTQNSKFNQPQNQGIDPRLF